MTSSAACDNYWQNSTCRSMRSHTRLHSGTGDSPASPRTTGRRRVSVAFWSVIDWLRAGYTEEAPRQGHSPLIALNGPPSLSDKQTREIADGLAPRADRIDVEVAIIKATDRLPTDAQVHRVRRALAPPRDR
jgi:hypothetical protein